jgi:hypothetical protein
MSLDDLLEPEVLIAVGVTAAIMSPPVRKVMRKGAVYGLAGMLMLGDKVRGMARGVSQGAQNLAASARNAAAEGAGTAERQAAGAAAG